MKIDFDLIVYCLPECAKRQPLSVVNAYITDDKVHYPDEEESIYVSTVDNNVWELGVYGWDEVI